ncbi:MAG: protein TolR [Gammaproteobacteria bacterium]|nr:protein TolR [Gammaproteobacteria bacterium]
MARPRHRREHLSEMNVVPYIDVMLVLLVIFMITAPLLSQGVKVDLPKAASEPLKNEQREPVVVTVDAKGRYFLDIGDSKSKPIDDATLIKRVETVLRRHPETPVLVRGDKKADYGAVVAAMALLQQAGAGSVGLMTEMPESRRGK